MPAMHDRYVILIDKVAHRGTYIGGDIKKGSKRGHSERLTLKVTQFK